MITPLKIVIENFNSKDTQQSGEYVSVPLRVDIGDYPVQEKIHGIILKLLKNINIAKGKLEQKGTGSGKILMNSVLFSTTDMFASFLVKNKNLNHISGKTDIYGKGILKESSSASAKPKIDIYAHPSKISVGASFFITKMINGIFYKLKKWYGENDSTEIGELYQRTLQEMSYGEVEDL